MTRKVTASLYMTLDGRGEFPDYPGNDYQTDEPDAFAEMWTKKYGTVDTVVFGRRAFERSPKLSFRESEETYRSKISL